MILSITPTNQCLKEQRCPYCFLSNKNRAAPFEHLYERMEKLLGSHQPETVTFAYNQGYPLDLFEILLARAHSSAKVAVTLQPDAVAWLTKATFKHIDFVALSYNTTSLKQTNLRLITNQLQLFSGSLKVGINFLADRLPNLPDLMDFFRLYQDCFEQFHFLVPKQYRIPYNISELLSLIKVLKMIFPRQVFIDECLRTIITKTPCRRNGNLLSLNADASVTKCSFAGIDDQFQEVTECPYFYGSGISEGET